MSHTLSHPDSSRRLAALFQKYLDETCERFPEMGSRLGFDRFRPFLGRNTAADHQAQIQLTRETLAALEELPPSSFAGDDWLDRRCFLSHLRHHQLMDDELERWRTNPQIHVDAAVESLFELVVHARGQLSKVLDPLASRLQALPDYLEAGAQNIKHPVPLWTALAEQSCEGAVEFVRELEPDLVRVAPRPDKFQQLCSGAIRAFELYARSISRKKSGPDNGFSLGRERFEFLMRERLGLDWSLPEALAAGRAQIERCRVELEAEARRHGRRRASDVLAEAATNWTPSEPLIDLYRSSTTRLRQALESESIVTLPGSEQLDVLPVPAFLRHQFPTAAYSAPPPYAKAQRGIFWVNDLSLLAKTPTAARKEVAQHYGLELTCGHEAYPGHHLQFVIQNRHPSKIRRLADHSIYYEGWTMWCEKILVDRGLIADPNARLIQLHDALWRAHRIVIDCGLHDGSLTFSGACRELCRGVGFTPARARGDVNWYTASPTVPMSYLLGRLEVEKLYSGMTAEKRLNLQQFNDWVLSHGAIPWSWIWQSRLSGLGG